MRLPAMTRSRRRLATLLDPLPEEMCALAFGLLAKLNPDVGAVLDQATQDWLAASRKWQAICLDRVTL